MDKSTDLPELDELFRVPPPITCGEVVSMLTTMLNAGRKAHPHIKTIAGRRHSERAQHVLVAVIADYVKRPANAIANPKGTPRK